MYLRGGKLNMKKRSRRPSNPLLIGFLVIAIGGLIYFNQVVVPDMPPLFLPSPTPTRSQESVLNEAQAFFTEGKLSQSIDAYKEAVLADPRNPATFIELARIQVFAGEYEDAVTNAENALLLNPNNSMAYAIKASALDFLGEYNDAELAVNKAIELDPNNAAAYAYYTEILLDQGNYEDIQTAIEMSQKAQALDPTALETHRARGYVLFITGNFAEAITEYQAAIAINDKLWDLHYSLGAVYKLQGEYDKAIQEMLTGVALNPTNPDILTEISRTYATEGQYGKAIQFAQQALTLDPSNPRLHGNLGVMYYQNDEFGKASEELSLAVHGGTAADGTNVNGLPLAPGRVADDYYSVYALSLTQLDHCPEAIPIMQLILSNIAEDQVAFYNATQGMDYCKTAAGTPASATSVPAETETPAP
jgi:tetratricopeptide (TPR) repeat protein